MFLTKIKFKGVVSFLFKINKKNDGIEMKKNCQKEITPKPNESHMLRAIALGRKGALIEKSGGPFGCVIVDKNGEVIAEGYNQVIKNNDPTWHAEMHAIRDACQKVRSPHLTGCVLYTSAECCPMCLAAAYWARISHIFYASHMTDAYHYGKFQDLEIVTELVKEPQTREIPSYEFKRQEAVEVWKEFSSMPNRTHY